MLPGKILGIFYMYGLMIAVGIVCCFGILFWYGKKKKMDANFVDFIFYIAVAAIALGFGSATLFQATYDYIQNPSQGFDLSSGMTFIGGLIGGVVSFLALYFLLRKKFKGRLVDIISFIPCCILIAHAFGRLGCFFAGCCHGGVTDSIFGVSFPKGTSAARLYPDLTDPAGGSLPVHPTQLYEAFFLFALFAVCFFLVVKKDFKHNMSVYLIAYGIFRFCLEFLRGDDRGALLGSAITPSQFWSICMVVAGVGVYFLLEWAYKKRAAELAQAPQAESTEAAERTEEPSSELKEEKEEPSATNEADEPEREA